MRKAYALVASILLCLFSHAVTKTVQSNVGSGWGTDTNWSPNGVPQSGDEVIIPAGQTITVKGGFYSTAANLKIYIHGNLDFDPSGRLNLGSSSLVQLSSSTSSITSNGTSSEQIVIGGGIKYIGANDGTVTGPAFTTNASPNSTSGTAKSGFTFGVLPVKLIFFTAMQKSSAIRLEWVTVLEENLQVFEVQKSTNGQDWTSLANVQPRNTCQCTTAYQYEDQSPQSGANYYRLRSVDRDGSVNLSPVIQAKWNGQPRREIAWSLTGAGSFLSLSLKVTGFQFPVQLQLVSANGQVLLQKNLVANVAHFDLRNAPSGMVVLYLQDKLGKKAVVKLVK